MNKRDLIQEEYRDVDGYWIYLKYGWVVPGDAHGIVENSNREAYAKLKSVVPCSCKECEAHK